MKKTYWKVLRRTIWHTISRFLSIFTIVALGVGFLAGILSATPDMKYSGDKYFDETHLADIRVVSTLGLTAKDLDIIKSTEGIDEIMPGQAADTLMDTPTGDTLVTRLHGVPLPELEKDAPQNYLNRFVIVDGRMPVNENECVIEIGTYSSAAVEIGGHITLSSENEDMSETLAINDFKVVGTVKSAYYFSFEREPSSIGNGTIQMIAYVGEKAFNREEYTEIYLTVKNVAAMNSLTAEYDDIIDKQIDLLEANLEPRRLERLNEVKITAQAKLNDAKEEFNTKKAEADEKLADAEKTIKDGKADLADAETKLANGNKELQDGERELADAKAEFDKTLTEKKGELASAIQQISDGKASIAGSEELLNSQAADLVPAREKLDAGKAQLLPYEQQLALLEQQKAAAEAAYAANPSVQNKTILDQLSAAAAQADAALAPQRAEIAAGEAQLKEGEAKIASARQQIAAIKAELEQAEALAAAGIAELNAAPAKANTEFAKAEKEIADGKKEIQENTQKLNDAKIELADGEKEYIEKKAEANQKISDAQTKIDDAQSTILELEIPDYYALNRKANVSFASFDGNISKVDAVARVFPIFFFLVAALVALTTMTRLVEEERLQIGTLKALGYKNSAIAFKYLFYAFTATTLGCIVGLLVGFNLLPRVIWNAYSMMYNLPELTCQFNISFAIWSSSAAILVTLFTTYSACRSCLKENAAGLLLPRAPKAGKRILLERWKGLWSHLKFTHKVTARNVFRYKKRFFMTVFGIAGCTALLLTGFGLRDSINSIIDKQFGEIFMQDITISVKEPENINDENITTIINDKTFIQNYLAVHEEKSTNTYGSQTATVYLTVPQNQEKFAEFINTHTRHGKTPIILSDDGVIITEKLSTRAGVNVGDNITLKNKDEKTAEFKVSGIAENYVENYVYITPQIYTNAYGTSPSFTEILAITTEGTAAAHDVLMEKLLKCDNVNNVSFVSDFRKSFDDMLKNVTYVVYVLIVAAAILAFVVMYNLTNINIAEREKEIATIKVLGFYDTEVAGYIYRESALLSCVGTVAGLILGIALHSFVIHTAEVDAVMFGRQISPYSFIISAALTLLFSALVSVVMNFKLRRINMVESMKAPE